MPRVVPPMEWRFETVLGILNLLEHAPDPDDSFQEWVDQADEADGEYLQWALGAWYLLRNLSSYGIALEREKILSLQREYKLGLIDLANKSNDFAF